MEYNPIAHQYEEDILSGRIKAGKLLKLAIKRQREDLKNGHKRGLYFDHEAGQKILDFCDCVNLSPDEPIKLAPFQIWELYVFYGWKRDNDLRRFRFKYKSVARKNGKTPLESVQILYHLTVEDLFRAEAYVSATKEDQAQIAFDDAKMMLEFSPDLGEYLNSSATAIFNPENRSKFKFLTSNPKTADGTRPSFAVIDEYHEFDNDDMQGKLVTGMIHRKEPILNIVTTRGVDKSKPCFQAEEKTYVPILKGIVQDDSTFVLIFSLDEEDDWLDESNYVKANPMIGHILRLEDLVEARNKAIQKGEGAIVKFKTLNLNLWCNAAKTWIADETYMAAGSDTDLSEFEGQECYGGLDLAKRDDFCSLGLAFPRPGESDPEKIEFDMFWWHWIPEATVDKRVKDGLHSLQDWIKNGWITVTEGNVTDYDVVEKDIKALFERFRIMGISFDQHNIGNLATNLGNYGLTMTIFPQTMANFSEPTKIFKNSILQGRLNHGNNPVMRWEISNAVEISDNNENIRITKDHKRAKEKVDGVIAGIMAVAEWKAQCWNGEDNGPSRYEDDDAEIFML